jgi:hypothetical protein
LVFKALKSNQIINPKLQLTFFGFTRKLWPKRFYKIDPSIESTLAAFLVLVGGVGVAGLILVVEVARMAIKRRWTTRRNEILTIE